jgi:acyl dehydratase
MPVTSSVSTSWERAWQPLIDAVGTDFGGGLVREGPDVVEPGALRRFCEPLELDCPLHHDPTAARRLGFRAVVAPVSSLVTFTIPPLWRPGEPAVFTSPERDAQPARSPLGPPLTGLEPDTSGYFAAEAGADYLVPVVAGDRLSRAGHLLLACRPRQTSVGRGAFVTWQSELRNQHGEVVARLRSTSYSYVPEPGGRTSPPVPAAPAPAVTESAQPAQRAWEDVAAGQAVPPVQFPLSAYRLVMAAGASRDFNSIHHNTDWARASGAPDMYANVVFLQGMWERCVREFIGPAGQIRRLAGFRMGSFNTVGDTVTVRGEVARTWTEGPAGLADLRLWSQNRHGVSVGPGAVTVSLPRRQGP